MKLILTGKLRVITAGIQESPFDRLRVTDTTQCDAKSYAFAFPALLSRAYEVPWELRDKLKFIFLIWHFVFPAQAGIHLLYSSY